MCIYVFILFVNYKILIWLKIEISVYCCENDAN